MLQLTGWSIYGLKGKMLGLPLLDAPDLAVDPADRLLIAREFWRRAGVNGCVDRGEITGEPRATNGGMTGLADVVVHRKRLLGC